MIRRCRQAAPGYALRSLAAVIKSHRVGQIYSDVWSEPLELDIESKKIDTLVGLAPAADLPGVRRKLHNLAQRTAAKRSADRGHLADALARIAAR